MELFIYGGFATIKLKAHRGILQILWW